MQAFATHPILHFCPPFVDFFFFLTDQTPPTASLSLENFFFLVVPPICHPLPSVIEKAGSAMSRPFQGGSFPAATIYCLSYRSRPPPIIGINSYSTFGLNPCRLPLRSARKNGKVHLLIFSPHLFIINVQIVPPSAPSRISEASLAPTPDEPAFQAARLPQPSPSFSPSCQRIKKF